MLHDFFPQGRASFQGALREMRPNTHADTHTQEYLSPMFFTPFSTASSHFSLLLLMLSLLLFFVLFCLFSHSESKKGKADTGWTLEAV